MKFFVNGNSVADLALQHVLQLQLVEEGLAIVSQTFRDMRFLLPLRMFEKG
jgi:hypothetical protein